MHNLHMGNKRAYGSGSISELRPGVYKLRWRVGVDPMTGKHRMKTETFTGTSKQAQRRLGECVSAVPTSTSVATVGQLRTEWARVANVSESTMERYDFSLRHVPAGLWKMRADAVTPPMIADCYRHLTDAGVQPQGVAKAYTALSSMFRHGVEWGWIDRNPCANVRRPTLEPTEYVVPTPADLLRMFDLAAAKSDSQSVWLRLAMATGARRGEVLALRWCDIDLERGAISITGSMGKKGRGATKNRQSVRLVAIDADTLALLRQWRRMCAERSLTLGVHVGDDWHVVSDDPESGRPVLLNTATHRLNRLAKAAGCPGARLHDLRHAHATMLLEAGVSTRTVADRLGHSRVSTTTDIYGHVLAKADEAAAATFATLLNASHR